MSSLARLSTMTTPGFSGGHVRLVIESRRGLRRKNPPPGKPPNLLPSKKVLYNVVHLPWEEPSAVEQLLWRRHVYNNALISMREVFRREAATKEASSRGLHAVRARVAEEFEQLLKRNADRNQRMADERDARAESEARAAQRETLLEVERVLDSSSSRSRRADEIVRELTESSRNWVTRETLEQRIVSALENPTVYNYAIDKAGKKTFDPQPVKYMEGVPTRQQARIFDRTLGSDGLTPLDRHKQHVRDTLQEVGTAVDGEKGADKKEEDK